MFLLRQKVVWVVFVLQASYAQAMSTSQAHNTTSNHVSFANNTGQTSLSSRTAPLPSLSTTEAGIGQASSSTTAHGMGDFIAMGMGISDTSNILSTDIADVATNATSSDTVTSPIHLPSHHSSHSSDGSVGAMARQNASNIESSPMTSSTIGILNGTGTANSSTSPSGYIPVGTELPVWGNQSLTLNYSGDCWNQWNQYWSAEDLPADESTYLSFRPGEVSTETYIEGNYLSTSTFTSSYETTVFNGRFPITTYTTTGPVTEYDVLSGTPTTTWFATDTIESILSVVVTRPTVSLQSPSCILPSSVSQCQQSWDQWVNQRKEQGLWERQDGPPGCDPAATTEIPWSCQAVISSFDSAQRSFFARDDPPKCSQAKVADDYCSYARSVFLRNGEWRGYYFPDAPQTATTIDGKLVSVDVWPSDSTIGGAGCTIGCGNCALQGETVELLYWPPATSLANRTATIGPDEPWTVEMMGTTLTSPTVYISFDKLWAKNSCSQIGGTYTNTLVAITKTGDMSSLYGYINRQTAQMSASFNFTDLYQHPTPDEIYESQPRCWRSSRAAQGGRYRPMPANYTGCARTEPYEPIIKIPVEVRALDLAWADCNGGIEGVYDPPIALIPTDAIAVPTKSKSRTITSSAAPASSPFSNPAPKTTHAQSPNTKPAASAEPAVQDGAAGSPVGTNDQAPQETPKTTRTSGGNVWPLPPSDPDSPDTTNALSVLKSAQASAEAAQIAASFIADAAKHQSGNSEQGGNADTAAHHTQDPGGSMQPAQIAASFIAEAAKHQSGTSGQSGGVVAHHDQDPDESMRPAQIAASLVTEAATHQSEESGQSADVGAGRHRTGDTHGSINHDANDPLKPAQTSIVWTQDNEVFTAILAGGSAKIQGGGAVTTIASGDDAVFKGQKIGISSEGDRIEINGAAMNIGSIDHVANDGGTTQQTTLAFEASGQPFTAVPLDKSLVLQAAGATTTIAYGAQVTFAGNTLSLPSSSGSNAIDVNGQWVTMHALNRDTNSITPSSAVWAQGGEIFTARMQSGSTIVLEVAGTTRQMTAGSTITLGDVVYSVPSPGGVLVHDGTSVTLNRAAATDATRASAASDHSSTAAIVLDAGSFVVVKMGDRTFTLADGAQTTYDGRIVSADSTGGAVVIDGTVTVGLSTSPSTAHPSGSSSTDGTEESMATTTDVQGAGSAGRSPIRAAPVFALFSFLLVMLH